MSKTLLDYRKEIDELDVRLMELLGERMNIIREVAVYKKANHLPAVIQARVDEVRNNAVALAKENNLPEDYIYDLWTKIITESCDTEERFLTSDKNKTENKKTGNTAA